MKKTFLAIISFLMIAILAGCGESEVSVFRDVKPGDDDSVMMTQYISTEDWVYGDFVDIASNVFKGTFVEYTEQEDNGSYDLIFKVGENLKGECSEEKVHVHIIPSNWTGEKYEEYNFVKGHEYLLITEKHVMRSLDHDRYYPLGEIFIPLTDQIDAYIDYRPMNGGDVPMSALSQSTNQQVVNESLVLYTTELCKDSEIPEPVDIPFTRSENLSEVIQESEYILLVTTNDQWQRDSGIYYCSVDEVIRNSYSVPDKIVIPFISDDIASGQSYYVLLNRAGSTSDWFAESSPNSMFAIDDVDAVENLMIALGLA